MLVAMLGNKNAWWRTTAQRLLVERGWYERFALGQNQPSSVPLLLDLFSDSPNSLAKLHALWTLQAIDRTNARVGIQRLAEHPDPILREHAIRVDSYDHVVKVETKDLIRLADDPAIRVRLQAALALGDRCAKEPKALKALAKIATRDASDPWMRLAILSGLVESAPAFLPLCEGIPDSEGRSELLRRCAAIAGAAAGRDETKRAAMLGRIADRIADAPADAMTLLAGFADGRERIGQPIHALIASPPSGLKGAIDRLAPLWTIAMTKAKSNEPIPGRLAALDVLARCRPDLAEGIIPALLAADQPSAVRSAAARAVARVGRAPLAKQVLDRWEALALATRRELLPALAGSPALAVPLVDAMERQIIAPRELDAATRNALGHLADPKLRDRAGAVLARFAPPSRGAAIERYLAALKLDADADRGRAVFVKNCQTCHQRQGEGHKVGPDLSGVAGRAPDALLSDILDPNKNVEPDYVAVAAATRNGQVFSGLLVEETTTNVKLRRAEGVEDVLPRSEVEDLRSTGQSLMPEGLEQSINVQEMADLIAFLRRGSTP
jgi:putative heme-binding domain-containing protein